VLDLINNSLINCAWPTVVIPQWYWGFITQKRIHFKTWKNPGFPGFLFSENRNPGFKILPRIGNTNINAIFTL